MHNRVCKDIERKVWFNVKNAASNNTLKEVTIAAEHRTRTVMKILQAIVHNAAIIVEEDLDNA